MGNIDGPRDSRELGRIDRGPRVKARIGAFLMAFVNPRLSVHPIRRQHCNEQVRELIPTTSQV